MDQQAGRDLRGDPPSFCNLLDIAIDALDIHPRDYVRSILGPYRTWLPPHDRYSEFTMLDLWQLRRAVKYLANISVPSIPVDPPRILDTLLPPVLKDLFFAPTQLLHRADYYGDYTSYPDEKWFFINGILTNGDVAQLNAAYLTYLFHRPITLIQNSTDGAIADLWECALEKEWYGNPSNTEPARIAFPALYDALTDPNKRRVVVICHSQGTIIMAVLLWALKYVSGTPLLRSGARPLLAGTRPLLSARQVDVVEDDLNIDKNDFKPLEGEHWEKLEIYCFATCCNEMRYRGCDTYGQGVPWIEHFGNQNDIVARLGMLAPRARALGINIEGDCYVADGAWGHLLDADYLRPIADSQKQGHRRGGCTGDAAPFRPADPAIKQVPRLYSYINGGTPASASV